MKRSRFRAALGIAGVIALTAVVTYGGLVAVGVQLGGSSEAQLEPSRPGGNLLVRERDHLTICVEWIPPDFFSGDTSAEELPTAAPEQVAVEAAVEAALPILAQHPVWPKLTRSELPPEVSGNCPSGPAAFDSEAGAVPGLPASFFNVPGRTVTTASPYRLHVFVVSQDEIDRLGGQGWRYTVEESMCWGHVCSEVTSGLYMSASEMTSQDFLVARLARAIGLE